MALYFIIIHYFHLIIIFTLINFLAPKSYKGTLA